MDRGAWQATAHGVAELDMTERLSLSLLSKLVFLYQIRNKFCDDLKTIVSPSV